MDWRLVARAQGGAIARHQLLAAGLTRHVIDGLVARGDVVEVQPGVYSPLPVADSVLRREWGAVLWSSGVLSHRSAARLWGIPAPDTLIVHVTVGDRRFRRPASKVRIHRVRLPASQVSQVDGVPATSRPRTVIDLLRTERYAIARDLRDRALQQNWIRPDSMARSIADQPGRTGNVQLHRLIDELDVGAQAESERLLHRLLRRAGLPGWVSQHPVRTKRGTVFVDVAFRQVRLAIEVDGRRFHDEYSDRWEEDRTRQNDLVEAGWHVLRLTWAMLTERPDEVIRQIAQLLAVLDR